MTGTFWRGKRVFLTGHTGFKGAWLAVWLRRLGAEVSGFALPPATDPSLFALAQVASQMDSSSMGDIRDRQAVADAMRSARPDIVLHLAAQALVRRSYHDPVETYSSNMMGTVHVLDAVRQAPSAKVVVIITTDKVYRNDESFWPYREDDRLGGHDPYSASKAACEIVVESYRGAFLGSSDVRVATARAGNVIGGGDWATDRLLPDAIKAWSAGRTLAIRNPRAVRPWQHVLEPLHGYLTLAERLWSQPDLATSFNFGPDRVDCVDVGGVIRLAASMFGSAEVALAHEADAPRETARLTLDNSKARELLGIQPVWHLATALERTVSWYAEQQRGSEARALCLRDIDAFEAALGAAIAKVPHAI